MESVKQKIENILHKMTIKALNDHEALDALREVVEVDEEILFQYNLRVEYVSEFECEFWVGEELHSKGDEWFCHQQARKYIDFVTNTGE